MRTPEEIVQGTLAWALEASTEIQTGYGYVTGEKVDGPMPDVMVEIMRDEITRNDSDFPTSQLQNVWLNKYSVIVSVSVNNSDAEAAAQQLRRIEQDYKLSLLADGTLGGRVYTISPAFKFDLTPPFVEYDDGTKAREMRLLVTVGELVELEE